MSGSAPTDNPKGLSIEVHDVGLAVIEVGRKLLHAARPDWDEWARDLESHADALENLAVRLRTEGRRAR